MKKADFLKLLKEKVFPKISKSDQLCLTEAVNILGRKRSFKFSLRDFGDEIHLGDAFEPYPDLFKALREVNTSWRESSEAYVYYVRGN